MSILKAKIAHSRKCHEKRHQTERPDDDDDELDNLNDLDEAPQDLNRLQGSSISAIDILSNNQPCFGSVVKKEEQLDDLNLDCSQVFKRRVQTSNPKTRNVSSNNIMKNYSRALTRFALLDLAQPYLKTIAQKQSISLACFNSFIRKDKCKVNSIQSLRSKLLVLPDDGSDIVGCKRAFQAICEVFLKYFSVNWIFDSRIGDKQTHINYRFKILRRVRNPEYFTYLEDFNK